MHLEIGDQLRLEISFPPLVFQHRAVDLSLRSGDEFRMRVQVADKTFEAIEDACFADLLQCGFESPHLKFVDGELVSATFLVLLDHESLANNLMIARQLDSTLGFFLRKGGATLARGEIPFDRVQPSWFGRMLGIGERCRER